MLLFALAMLVLASVMLTSVVRFSLNSVLEASRRREELQTRWGEWSLRRELLYRLPEICQHAPPSRRLGRETVQLGTTEFLVACANEAAKLPVHLALENLGAERGQELITAVAPSQLPWELQGELASSRGKQYRSWGQVFALERFSLDAHVPQELLRATERLTLWSRGKMSLNKTPRELTERLLAADLGGDDLDKLLEAAAAAPKAKLADWLTAAGLSFGKKQAVQKWFGDSYGTYSLWIVSAPQQAPRAVLSVLEVESDGRADVTDFHW